LAGVLTDAASTLAACMDMTGEGIGLLVYNPLAFARQDVVEATIPLDEGLSVRVIGPDGAVVPSQIVERTGGQAHILFLADLPSCGAAAFRVEPRVMPETYDTGLRVDRSGLENHRYRIAVDDTGQITSIVDKADADRSQYPDQSQGGGRELLAGPIEYQFLRETPMIFPAWNMEWRDRKKAPYARLGGPAQIEVVESGPVRVSLRISRTFGGSRFEQQIRLACGGASDRAGQGAGDRIEFADTIDWRETGCSLKAAFPLTVSAPEATYNWELGKIRRGNNDPAKFEVPAHQWFDLTDADGSYGVTVLEDCKYGSDKPADNVLRLTVLFTPRIGPLDLAFRDQGSQDWGRHHVLYGLYGHRGDWREGGSERQALRLNQPPRAFRVPAAPGVPGPLGRQLSFVQIDSEQVGLRAMKRAEDGDSIILRVHELWGRPTGEVTLTVGGGITGDGRAVAWETDGLERRVRELEVQDGKLTFRMGAFGIVTFEVAPLPGDIQATAPVCAPLRLPLDVRAFTHDSERERGELAGGRSYPREWIPVQIDCGRVPLYTGVNLDKHAVACRGQALALPEGDYDTLALLMAADEDIKTTIYLDETPVPLRVQADQGFIGQWDRRIWDRPMEKQPDYIWRAKVVGLQPGAIKRDRVGWYTTHMHGREGNEPYAYGYMFLYTVPLPPGARRLRLPDDPKIRVYAATAAKGAYGARPAAALYDEFK
jgi:alpha-mannosidase